MASLNNNKYYSKHHKELDALCTEFFHISIYLTRNACQHCVAPQGVVVGMGGGLFEFADRPTSIHTYRHHSDQISRPARWGGATKTDGCLWKQIYLDNSCIMIIQEKTETPTNPKCLLFHLFYIILKNSLPVQFQFIFQWTSITSEENDHV